MGQLQNRKEVDILKQYYFTNNLLFNYSHLPLMEAIISDITGQTVSKILSYKVDVFSRSSTCHLEIDMEANPELMNLLSVAVKNGRKWYKITKKDNKWERVELETQPLQ